MDSISSTGTSSTCITQDLGSEAVTEATTEAVDISSSVTTAASITTTTTSGSQQPGNEAGT